ncbi:hypothetical protein DUI87_26345 [Hirundo rustica rustica]|uniref:Uncharacterized protein n=1 Tax=Hirundo rustica rustica TaxID=333673 RepID=A0A3M0J879_HIRRU|nr:hypothetical protein DUI87_26345 [Hirundo rustica rustica]
MPRLTSVKDREGKEEEGDESPGDETSRKGRRRRKRVMKLQHSSLKWKICCCRQVPAIGRDIYQWLSFITVVSAEHRLDNTLQEMTLAQPHDVVVTLLRCAPSRDRFALLTMKALLSHLEYEDVMSEVERECGWDTLLNTDTHHHTMGLLARAMLTISQSLCYQIARYLFRLLCREEARWEVAAMALLVEASWETLLQATIFLKKWNLEQLLKKEEQWRFGECLLEEERDRADRYLRQSVMYLQSPQKSMREAAIRLIGEPKPSGSLLPYCSLVPAPAAGLSPLVVLP